MTDTASDRAVVEQAKGAIMLRYGVSSYESLAALAGWAREAHVPLPEVASTMVRGICQGRVTSENQGLVRWLEQRLRVDIGESPQVGEEPGLRGRTAVRHRHPPAQAPRSPAAAAAARQWRFTSALHAARALSRP